MINCLCCGKETSNPKFCSRSCAAKVSNKLYPKRKLTRTCTICGEFTKSYRHTKCEKHWLEFKETRYKNRTIGEYRQMMSVKGKHPSWIHAHIRQFARSWLRHMIDLPCAHCGYEKHVELAHIKSVSSFPDDTLLSVVNSPDNVIQLCPNCHWEFDNLPRESKSVALSN